MKCSECGWEGELVSLAFDLDDAVLKLDGESREIAAMELPPMCLICRHETRREFPGVEFREVTK